MSLVFLAGWVQVCFRENALTKGLTPVALALTPVAPLDFQDGT